MSYKNAFNCKHCPQNNGAAGCPVWWEIVYENVVTAEVKTLKDCGYKLMPLLMTEVIKASNRPAAAVESMRNHMQANADNLFRAIALTAPVLLQKDANQLNLPIKEN